VKTRLAAKKGRRERSWKKKPTRHKKKEGVKNTKRKKKDEREWVNQVGERKKKRDKRGAPDRERGGQLNPVGKLRKRKKHQKRNVSGKERGMESVVLRNAAKIPNAPLIQGRKFTQQDHLGGV